VAVGASLVAAGTDVTGAIVYAAAILGVTLTFAATGVLAAQMMPARSDAVGLTIGLLGFDLLLRMLADGVPQMAWSAWATPFGLAERAAPYAENRVTPLIVLACFPIVLAVTALAAADRRDLAADSFRYRPSVGPEPDCWVPSADSRSAAPRGPPLVGRRVSARTSSSSAP
jgi:ABC-2 type transport system permease protein